MAISVVKTAVCQIRQDWIRKSMLLGDLRRKSGEQGGVSSHRRADTYLPDDTLARLQSYSGSRPLGSSGRSGAIRCSTSANSAGGLTMALSPRRSIAKWRQLPARIQ